MTNIPYVPKLNLAEVLSNVIRTVASLSDELDALQNPEPIPLDDWCEEEGPVLWWFFPIEEEPYCGTPLDDDWPGYHTHWTHIIIPIDPAEI